MPNEMPSITSTSYAASNALYVPLGGGVGQVFGGISDAWQSQKQLDPKFREIVGAAYQAAKTQQESISVAEKKRLVRVLVVDPHDDVPVESGLLYDSKEVFTDKTDQELYFDVPIVQILKDHNDKRTKIVNKAVKDRTEYLEPARIRDLKMLVIALAQF